MAPYDSDSSGGEEEDYTETNVLLGYASADANGEEVSRLGGRPVRTATELVTQLRTCLLTLTIGLVEPGQAAICCASKMQGLQGSHGALAAAQRRATGPISQPRAAPIRSRLQEEELPQEGGEHTRHTEYSSVG